jgi:hypothetical protein
MAEDYVEFASNMMLSSWTRSAPSGGKGPGSVRAAAAAAATASSGTTAIAFGYHPPTAVRASSATASNGNGRSASTTNNGHDSLHYYPLETISALSYLKSPMRRPMVLERWSPYEVAIFEATLAQYGKDFLQVQKELASSSSSSSNHHRHANANNSNGKSDSTLQGDAPSASGQYQYCNKSTKDVVEFYYIWKKTSHYQRWKATYVAPHEDDSDDDDDESDDEVDNSKKENDEPVVKPKRKYTRRVPPAAAAAAGAAVGDAGTTKNKQA